MTALSKAEIWMARHPRLIIALALVAGLGPFLNKAVDTDDALFVWAGQWIQGHPADFYGAHVNWWVSSVPMWVANWNPPLLSYFFAAVACCFGWSEVVLHLASLVVAFAAGAGIYSLAQRWCSRPLLATLISVFSPAFFVSSSTLMCDVLMLAFWIWAVVLWERALARPQHGWLFAAAGVLAGLAVLTKYSAVTLVPILPVLALLRNRKPYGWLLGVALPVIMVAGYELLTSELYGRGLLSAASYHARSFRPGFPGGWRATGIIGLAFAGGSLLPGSFLAPLLWRPKFLLAGAAVLAGGSLIMFQQWDNLGLSDNAAALKQAGYVLQVALLATGGLHLLLLAGTEVWQRRNLVSTILFLWIIGVLFFAIVANWLINARSFLPLVPAGAILLVRRLETSKFALAKPIWLLGPLALSVMVALSLVFSDCQAANTGRAAARQIAARYQPAGHQLWFVGHGAFQYYLQSLGAQPIDAMSSVLQPGDVVAVPVVNYGITSLPAGAVGWLDHVSYHPFAWMNLTGSAGHGAAGFYGANWGPIPFVIGGIPRQTYFVVKVCVPVQMDSKAINLPVGKIDDVPNIPKISCAVGDSLPFPSTPESRAQLQMAETDEADGRTEQAIAHYRQAADLAPDNPEALDRLAWLLATAGNPRLRNGAEAVQLAAKAVQLSDSRVPAFYGTLAAALAESGQFSRAAEMCKIAIALAHLTGQGKVENQNASLLRLYSAGKPADALTAGAEAPNFKPQASIPQSRDQ